MERAQSDGQIPNGVSVEALRGWLESRERGESFLRWAGGKRPFLARHAEKFPRLAGKYIEPFLGSAAVFFHYTRIEKRPFTSILGDINLQLIRTYIDLRDNPKLVIESLNALHEGYLRTSDRGRYYYDQRDIYNKMLPAVDPGRFIFLNRTGWNGLYRVNNAGKLNVPHGLPKAEVTFPSSVDLMDASSALKQTQLKATTWRTLINSATAGDFVFLDPPYYSDLLQASKYSRSTFTREEHFALGKACAALYRRGVDFMLTNSGEPEIVDFYRAMGFDIEHISVPRYINSKSELRIAASEVIVRPPNRGSLRLDLSS